MLWTSPKNKLKWFFFLFRIISFHFNVPFLNADEPTIIRLSVNEMLSQTSAMNNKELKQNLLLTKTFDSRFFQTCPTNSEVWSNAILQILHTHFGYFCFLMSFMRFTYTYNILDSIQSSFTVHLVRHHYHSEIRKSGIWNENIVKIEIAINCKQFIFKFWTESVSKIISIKGR